MFKFYSYITTRGKAGARFGKPCFVVGAGARIGGAATASAHEVRGHRIAISAKRNDRKYMERLRCVSARTRTPVNPIHKATRQIRVRVEERNENLFGACIGGGKFSNAFGSGVASTYRFGTYAASFVS